MHRTRKTPIDYLSAEIYVAKEDVFPLCQCCTDVAPLEDQFSFAENWKGRDGAGGGKRPVVSRLNHRQGPTINGHRGIIGGPERFAFGNRLMLMGCPPTSCQWTH
ncbi:hypothetical protein CEXT_330631 [Caerostris extrusa]|uniref:Uncharacterized protein n=1 Tax=Caerostris extrusa TaxID=172846 RepID=A0AAV4N3U9_CAEEX|nr:hypothetical protein CEXT_330631 [Caerostris extrusa]